MLRVATALSRPALRRLSSLPAALSERIAAAPYNIALQVDAQDIKWNGNELQRQVQATVGGMREMGMTKGDVMVMAVLPGAEKAVLELAAAYGGFTVVPMDLGSTGEQIADAVAKHKAAALYVSLDAQPDLGMLQQLKVAFPELTQEEEHGGLIFEGERIRFHGYPYLKYICHPAYADVPGTMRLRDILSYPSEFFKSLYQPADGCDEVPLAVLANGKKITHSDVLAKVKAGAVISGEGLL